MLKRPLLWLIILAMLSLQGACIASHWSAVKAGTPDFAALYGAAQSIHQGVVPDYDPKKIHGVDAALDSPGVKPLPLAETRVDTLHPPFEILLFLPFTFLSYPTAYIVWSAFNLVFAWLVLVVLWPYLPRLQPEFEVVAILYGTALPLIVCLLQGQDSILLLLLLSLAFVCLAQRKDRTAGYLLALGLFKFHLVLPIVAALLVARKWKTVAGFSQGFFLLMLATLFALGRYSTLGYLPFIAHYSRYTTVNASPQTILMPNIRGLVSFISRDLIGVQLQSLTVVAISVTLLIVMLVWNSRFRCTLCAKTTFSFAVAVTSLVSYHYYIHNAVILCLPMLLMADEILGSEGDRKLRQFFIINLALACATMLSPLLGIMSVTSAMPLLAVESFIFAGMIFAMPYRSHQRWHSGPRLESGAHL
jgi:hypothetical protein